MSRWKQLCAVLALGAAVAALPGEASAQQAPAQPAAQAAAPAKPPVVRARDLMTPQERQAYRQSMRAARSDPARQTQLRNQMRETLRQRATARGAVLAEPAFRSPAMAAKDSARPEKRPATPPRAP
ncbi:MAG: hypothetical protein WCO00_10970 [Rhodospirillaceae bacterium]